MAIDAGADALGLVGNMPSGPGVITDEAIREIAAHVPEDIDTFLLTSETTAAGIIDHHTRVKTKTIQIVDAIPIDVCANLRDALPGVNIVQVVHVSGEASLPYAQLVSRYADALLLDSGNPDLDVKVLGGTGKTHDWSISKRIVRKAGVPVYLAGGLNGGNVVQAIEAVQPFGLDLCSGVRSNGSLDPVKLEDFFAAAKSGTPG